MSLLVSYMGTKRQLAPLVSETISTCKDGPLMDLFSGMCAVGTEVGSARQVWSNDAQIFASSVAKAFFTSMDFPLRSPQILERLGGFYQENYDELEKVYGFLLLEERGLFEEPSLECQMLLDSKILNSRFFSIDDPKSQFPYCLFSEIYSGGYFSLQQAVELDSIRYAIDIGEKLSLISSEQHRWLLLALAQAMSKVSNTTGHFAQYIKVKDSNLQRVVNQKKRSVWFEWLNACDFIEPLGSKAWRKGNKAYSCCSNELLRRMKRWKSKPSVIYADPPYTGDQYSRYYHLYETLFLYDYPQVSGVGQYRPDRFRSSFSLKTEVHKSMKKLVSGCASAGCDLVLSYPDNGLLPKARQTILSILGDYYSHVEVAHEVDYQHSSLGGSKGKQKYEVQELLFLAKKGVEL